MGASQEGPSQGTTAGALQMPPRPGMPMSPSGGGGGGKSGAASPGSVPLVGPQPTMAPGMAMPSPSQPGQMLGGGPSSPFNIESLLKTQTPPPQVKPMKPYGDSQGSPSPDNGESPDGAQPSVGGDASGLDMGSAGGLSPMVMLRLLKAIGQI